MSTNNSMEELSVAQLMSKYNLIVPEIQREYVWGNNEFKILDTFIEDIKDGFLSRNNPSQEYSELRKLYEKADDKMKSVYKQALDSIETSTFMNIGFLYSYRPDYYVFNDRNDDVYLIDGQQRFTTLFLVLFYFAIKEDRLSDFKELFRFDEKLEHIAFDYRVRTLTHNFVIDLISRTKTIDDLVEINTRNWFLSNYKNDVTIKSIIGKTGKNVNGTFPILHLHFADVPEKYFDFVKNQIKFWHFKTEETSQGEELYITMNSRGQQLADNENIRAKLFENPEIQLEQRIWSEKWEKWQDFFWKHRDKNDINSTADKGLNEFLRWIQIIKMTESQEIKIDVESEDAPDKKDITNVIKWGKDRKLNVDFLNLVEIEQYFDALSYLYVDFKKELNTLQLEYPNYKNFNLIEYSWLCPKEDIIGQIDCFRLLPILYYCRISQINNITINPKSLLRLIRFFYNLRLDLTIFKTANVQCINGLKLVSKISKGGDILEVLDLEGISKSLLNSEVLLKINKYRDNEREAVESLFWIAEDLDVNVGKISHLIKFVEKISIDQSKQFSLKLFENIFVSYKELAAYKNKIWGDLLPTSVYNETDRVDYVNEWHLTEDFLNFVRKRNDGEAIHLNDFLIKNRKEFIVTNYQLKDEIESETSLKKQLYIYYILHSNLLSQWNWNGKYKFGFYNSILGNEKSLFKNQKIFQFYNKVWQYNMGYNKSNGIWIQDNMDETKDYLGELLKWANS